MANDGFTKLQGLVDHFEARRLRAAARLHGDEAARWFFAIVGLELDFDYQINPLLTLRRVVDAPGEIELAGALADKSLMSAVASYSHSIQHELCVDRDAGNQQEEFDLAWRFLSALRTRTMSDFLVPAVSDRSWSTIAGVARDSCWVQLIEDVPRARRFVLPVPITREQLTWVDEHFTRFIELLEKPAFRLAVDSLTTHQHEASLRMTTASLWAGVEALLGISSELRFRLSALIAAFLEARGPERVRRYRGLKKLYDFRSRAVHGTAIDDTALQEHISEVRVLLSSLLCKITELGRFPSDDDWDLALFG
jgi:hypothetical protein